MPPRPDPAPRHTRRLRPTALPDWPIPFDRRFELDWGDPEVSRRVLREHLDQSHDGASRRLHVVERHVRRLLKLLPAAPADVLDAACGPGLYAVRLARLGYTVSGIDVGDAALRHARSLVRDAHLQHRATFRRADLRTLDDHERHDAVLLIYYVLEAFRRSQQSQVLRRLAAALRPGGVLIAELRVRPDQPPGRLSAWDFVPFSILADRRHLLLTDAAYDDEAHTYVLREIAVLDDGVAVQQTTGAFTPLDGVEQLLARAGLQLRAAYDGWTRYRATGLSHSLLVVADKPEAVSRRR
ncbi:MAG TPA: class I SAM-dependent methyltransferase [Candidatus Dormibacteraeota bacterium]|nr:class I SAM-dependent methyltransferase [Candidatus Dormibacteraeota bacterium]